MAKQWGRSLPLSPFRRLVADMMCFSRQVPAAVIERRMNLSPLVEARRRCMPRPSWTVLFAKAIGLVARDRPELRRAYMAFPWPRLYEHPSSTVAFNVAREVNGEAVIVQCLIRRPENRSLAELEEIVRYYQDEPVERLRWYQRALAMSKLPLPLRRLLWWGTLNVFGRRRTHNFGTFGLSTIASQGAGVLSLTPILTATFHYGLFDPAGNLDVRFTLDHRVMDGVVAAHILVDVEKTMLGPILTELIQTRLPAAA
jgi:hypothetical protein